MTKLQEPLKHTCPDIDKFISEINKTLEYIWRFNHNDDIEELHDFLNDCENTLNSAIVNFESIRSDNDKLRKWGNTLSETLGNIIQEVQDYE